MTIFTEIQRFNEKIKSKQAERLRKKLVKDVPPPVDYKAIEYVGRTTEPGPTPDVVRGLFLPEPPKIIDKLPDLLELPPVRAPEVPKLLPEVSLPKVFQPSDIEGAVIDTITEVKKMIEPENSQPEIPSPVVITFRQNVSASSTAEETHRVPFDGFITLVSADFPSTAGLVRMRLLYLEDGSRQPVVPSLDDQYIALNSGNPVYNLHYPVKADQKLKAEFLNDDGGGAHVVSFTVNVSPKGMFEQGEK